MQTESVFGDPGLWALIGMAAMMGGTMRSPLTAMIFAVELTRDFNLFPALLIGSIAALGVTMLLMRRSILTEKFTRRGHHITREYSIDPFELARVRDVMDQKVPSVPAAMKFAIRQCNQTTKPNIHDQNHTVETPHRGAFRLGDSQPPLICVASSICATRFFSWDASRMPSTAGSSSRTCIQAFSLLTSTTAG
jgi:Voltage gated chloride channel